MKIVPQLLSLVVTFLSLLLASDASNDNSHNNRHLLSDSTVIHEIRNKSYLVTNSNTMTKTKSSALQKCLVDEYMGQTFYIPFSSPFAPHTCFKLDLSTTGSISVDHNGIDCSSNNPFTSSMKIGVYLSHTENEIYFLNDEDVAGYTTKLVVKTSPSVNGLEIGKFEYDKDINSFLLELLLIMQYIRLPQSTEPRRTAFDSSSL